MRILYWVFVLSVCLPTALAMIFSRWRRPKNIFMGVGPHDTIAFSSRQMAAVRALESERSDRIVEDPYAHILAGDEAMRQAHERMNAFQRKAQGIGRKIAVRTRYFDDFVMECYEKYNIKQFVLVGSGMDTRPYRLPLAQASFFELDSSSVLQAKDYLLRGVEGTVLSRYSIPCNVSEPQEWVSQMQSAGFNASEPTAFVLEGLLMYLDKEEVKVLLENIGKLSAVGSRVGISLVDRTSLVDAQASQSSLRQSWKWGCDEEEVRAFFERQLKGSSNKVGRNSRFSRFWRLGGGTGRWHVKHVVRVGSAGSYPTGANYGCWDPMKKTKRRGKTLYVVANRET